MKLKVFLSLLILPVSIIIAQPRQGKITVDVRGFIKVKGSLYIGLFDSNNHYGIRYTKAAFMHQVVPITNDGVKVVFDNIPSGTYSIAMYQDENSNGKFEYWNEDYALSNEGAILYRTPSFKQSKFFYDGNDQTFTIYLENEYGRKVTRTTNTALAPIIAYAPETKLQVGASLIRLFKFKPDTITRTSYFDYFSFVTLNKQIVVKGNYVIFTPGEKYLLTGYNWFQYFPQYFYGQGNDLPASNQESVSYSQFKIDALIQKHVGRNLFVGFGYRYSDIFHVSSPDTGVLNKYKYPGYNGSIISGLQFALTADSRDNIYFPVKGHYIRFKAADHIKQFGSNFDFMLIETELRKYYRPFPNRWDVLALQAYGYFAIGKGTPWSELAALGNGDLMRGYYSGRFRDNHYMAIQAEYRLVINKLFGMVFFLATGEVGNHISDFTLAGLKPNGGTGVRLKINRQDRLNLRFDMGIGSTGINFYLGASEAF